MEELRQENPATQRKTWKKNPSYLFEACMLIYCPGCILYVSWHRSLSKTVRQMASVHLATPNKNWQYQPLKTRTVFSEFRSWKHYFYTVVLTKHPKWCSKWRGQCYGSVIDTNGRSGLVSGNKREFSPVDLELTSTRLHQHPDVLTAANVSSSWIPSVVSSTAPRLQPVGWTLSSRTSTLRTLSGEVNRSRSQMNGTAEESIVTRWTVSLRPRRWGPLQRGESEDIRVCYLCSWQIIINTSIRSSLKKVALALPRI